jgi:hypothetical protein
MIAGLPTCPERDLPDTAEAAAVVIAKLAGNVKAEARFLWARSILKPPSWYVQVAQILREKYPQAPVMVVDPYTFFGLIRLQYDPE